MRAILRTALVLVAAWAVGCGGADNKPAEPRLGPDQQTDPRIQRTVQPGKNTSGGQLPATAPGK